MNQLIPGRFLMLLFASLFFINCKKISSVTSPEIIAEDMSQVHGIADTTSKTYLALGDSYTIGQSVDSSERFPAQTVSLLKGDGVSIYGIQYIATTGWTTLDLLSVIQSQKPKEPFAAVSLLIGVNDQYQTHDTSSYRKNFTKVISKALELAGNKTSHVFVLSIPDYGVTPFGNNVKEISRQIDLFNGINKEVSNKYGISYTDITGISRADGSSTDMIAFDGLHPSGKQYAQWSEALAPLMYRALK